MFYKKYYEKKKLRNKILLHDNIILCANNCTQLYRLFLFLRLRF